MHTATETAVTPSALTVGVQRLQQDLLRAVSATHEKRDAVTEVGRLMAGPIAAATVVFFGRDSAGQLVEEFQVGPQTLPPPWIEILRGTCNAACEHGLVQLTRIDGQPDALIVASPVFRRDDLPEAIAVVIAASYAELAKLVIQLGSAHLTLWHVFQGSARADAHVHDLAALVELLDKAGRADSLRAACLTLVNELQTYLQGSQIVLGLRDGSTGCRLEAVSGLAKFDKHSEFARAVEAACDEVLLRDAITHFPPDDETQRPGTLAHQRLCALAGAEAAIGGRLCDEQGEPVGAWLVLGPQTLPRPRIESFLRSAERPVGGFLELLRRTHSTWFRRAKRKTNWRWPTIVTAVVSLAAVLAIPVPYTMRCDVQMQPVVRRFVAAPFDGVLEKSLVAPGDVVAAGDVLARLDGREIRWELEGLRAEHSRAAKRRDSAMASHNVAEAQLAKLEMERHELKIQLLEHRMANLVVRSPVAGIVVSGDLEKAEGAPLTIGQSLFEIAPLDRMIAEIAVPEDDVAHAAAGQPVSLRLEAYPRKVWDGTVEKIHPRSEVREQQTVFIAEIALENPAGELRPGMNGRAKISGTRHLLGWNLFHKPWEKLVRLVW